MPPSTTEEVTLSSVARTGSPQGAHYTPVPSSSEDGRVNAHTMQTIQSDPASLHALWSNVEFIPRWQEFVISVHATSSTVSHWVMGNPDEPDGKRLEFDSEITEDVPGAKLAWRSITEGVDLAGSVTFKETPRGTLVTLLQQMKVPGGLFGSALIGAAKRSPEQVVKENLRHFKELAEAGEIPSVEGQPHGPRGVSGKVKAWMYGETNPTPPGTSVGS